MEKLANSQLLFTKQEAMKMLGVGEKIFRKLAISFVKVGKRKKYAIEDLQGYIRRNREEIGCLSHEKGRGRRTTGTTSRSTVIGFEEAQKLIASKRRKQS